MRKAALPTAFMLSLLAACAEPPTAPADAAVFPPDQVSFAKKVADIRAEDPFAVTFVNACAGELVALEGTLRTKTTLWDNGHAQSHQDFDLEGTGLTSGAKYNAKQIININVGPDGLPLTQRAQLNVVSAGSGDNAILEVHIHIDENGVTRVEDVDATAKCVG